MANFGLFREEISLLLVGAYWTNCNPLIFDGIKAMVWGRVEILFFVS